MMKCPTCESCEYAQYCGATEIMRKCERHNKKVEQTNEEWIKSATTEELAEWITELSELCTIHHQCELCDSWCDEKQVMEWLKQPHQRSKK